MYSYCMPASTYPADPCSLQACVQGMVQGALSSVKALAQGVGPLIYSGLFSLFSHKDGKLPYFPGESAGL